MKRIGVAVQGLSDFVFWNRVLHKHNPGHIFEIRNLKTQQKLVAEARTLSDSFRSARYEALFLLLDADDEPCVGNVRTLLDEVTRRDTCAPRDSRNVFLSVAFRELESWYMADIQGLAIALEVSIPDCSAIRTGGKAALSRFFREVLGRRLGYNERQLAEKMSTHFNPARARQNSPSFDHFWSCIEIVLAR